MNKKNKWDLLLISVQGQDQSHRDKNISSRSRQKNKKPEKLVEEDCLAWAKKNEIHLHVVEAKAVFSQAAGRYVSGQVESGFPDLVGNNNIGQVLYIELKAKDRRSKLSPGQYMFLKSKAEQGCFAVVVDSADRLHEFYYNWCSSKNKNSYLISLLPCPKELKDDGKPIF